MDQTINSLTKPNGRMCNDRGFTLIELITVLAILAIIAAIAVPRFTGTIETAKMKADQVTLDILQQAVNQYMIENNGHSPNKEDLQNGYIDGDWPEPQQGGKFEIDDNGNVLLNKDKQLVE